MATVPVKRRRSDGERSRRKILETAARLATVEGIEGLSLGRLAEETGMSKSGLYAHFGSKEDLELATVATAVDIFDEEVVSRALEAEAGRARLEALMEEFLGHLEREVFPGGCFFISVAAEVAVRPGPVLDRVARFQQDWFGLFMENIEVAVRRGELAPDADAEQLTFEIVSHLTQANLAFAISRDPEILERARRAVTARLDEAAG
jgi:AcrR family transcriptional regulator